MKMRASYRQLMLIAVYPPGTCRRSCSPLEVTDLHTSWAAGFQRPLFLSRALLPEAWRCGWLQAVRRPERSGLCDIHQTFAIAPVLQIELVCCRVRPTGIGSHAYRIETRRRVCFGCPAGGKLGFTVPSSRTDSLQIRFPPALTPLIEGRIVS